jgi:hypothetical protein
MPRVMRLAGHDAGLLLGSESSTRRTAILGSRSDYLGSRSLITRAGGQRALHSDQHGPHLFLYFIPTGVTVTLHPASSPSLLVSLNDSTGCPPLMTTWNSGIGSDLPPS